MKRDDLLASGGSGSGSGRACGERVWTSAHAGALFSPPRPLTHASALVADSALIDVLLVDVQPQDVARGGHDQVDKVDPGLVPIFELDLPRVRVDKLPYVDPESILVRSHFFSEPGDVVHCALGDARRRGTTTTVARPHCNKTIFWKRFWLLIGRCSIVRRRLFDRRTKELQSWGQGEKVVTLLMPQRSARASLARRRHAARRDGEATIALHRFPRRPFFLLHLRGAAAFSPPLARPRLP